MALTLYTTVAEAAMMLLHQPIPHLLPQPHQAIIALLELLRIPKHLKFPGVPIQIMKL